MKNVFYLIISLMFLPACSHNSYDKIDALSKVMNDEDSNVVLVVAHRSCWKSTAENSLSSIERCISLGVDIVELDVRKSKDGKLVLMHDATVNRTTNGRGTVTDLSFKRIINFSLRAGKGGDSAIVLTEKVPSLRDAYAVAKGKILINIDAKDDVIEDAIALAEEMGISDQIIIKAELDADDPKLQHYRSLIKDGFFMPKITQMEHPLSEIAITFAPLRPTAIEVKAKTEEYIQEGADEIEQLGARFWINTLSESPEKAAGHVDDVAILAPDLHWGKLLELGVDIIQTDEPESLIEYLSKTDRRLNIGHVK